METIRRPLRVCSAVVTAAVFAVPAIGASIDSVFDDQLAEQWQQGFWDCTGDLMAGCSSLSVSDVVHSGQLAIHVHHCCPGGFGAVGFERRTEDWTSLYWMYPNQYERLRFFFNPGSDLDGVTSLSLTLDNLSDSIMVADYIDGSIIPNTWYEVVIPLADANSSGNRFFRFFFFNDSSAQTEYYLDDVSLEWVDDDVPPVISDVVVSDLIFDGAQITWLTDEHTLFTLSYGAGDLDTVIEEDDYTATHEVVLAGLTPGTTYSFQIVASDHQAAAGTPANSSVYDGELITAPPDATPPVISNVQAMEITSSRATITWVTDELADSRVSYGQGDYTGEVEGDVLTTSHRVTLGGLEPESIYQFRIASQDRSGNLATHETNPPLSFTTTEIISATLTVDTTREIRPFAEAIRGANLGLWTFYYGRPYPNDSPKLRELTRLIKPGVLRYAGGLASNNITWDRDNTQCYPGRHVEGQWCDRRGYDPWWSGVDRCREPEQDVANAYRYGYQADEIDALAAFAEYVGAEVMIEVDITTCDPQLWADMVRYTRVEHDYPFTYWELGNELDLEHAWQTADIPVAEEYVRRYKEYYRAMKAVDDSIKIAGPTTSGHEEDGYFRAFSDFIDPLTQDPEILELQMLDLLTYHHYPMWNHSGGEVGHEDIFAFTYDPERRSRAHINHCATDKRELLDSRGFFDTPIAVTEFNAMAADMASSLVFNHAQALYMADTLARQAAAGADMVLHWELYDLPYDYDQEQVSSSYGLINHNHSSVSSDGTGAIVVDDRFTVMPVYYTYFMYAQLFGETLVEASSSREEDLSVWASTDASDPDGVWLMVVNLSSEAIRAELDVTGSARANGETFELANSEFAAATDKKSVIDGTFINDRQLDCSSAQAIVDSAAAIIASGRPMVRSGEVFVHVFPAYSATIVRLDPVPTSPEPRRPGGRRSLE